MRPALNRIRGDLVLVVEDNVVRRFDRALQSVMSLYSKLVLMMLIERRRKVYVPEDRSHDYKRR